MTGRSLFVRYPLACLLAATACAGCIQSPHAQARIEAAVGTFNKNCADGIEPTNLALLEQDFRTQGLELRMQCARGQGAGGIELVVVDALRASQVLRGPLADGEAVDLAEGANVSPDVRFNRAWLHQALQRHRLDM